MGIYSFDGGYLETNEGPEDEVPGFYLEHKPGYRETYDDSRETTWDDTKPYQNATIELDMADPDYHEKSLAAVRELTKRSLNRLHGKEAPDSA